MEGKMEKDELLKKVNEWVANIKQAGNIPWTDIDVEVLAQLRAILAEPTSEERKYLLSHFNATVNLAEHYLIQENAPQSQVAKINDDKIRALIAAPKVSIPWKSVEGAGEAAVMAAKMGGVPGVPIRTILEDWDIEVCDD
jgi:hypothetical protein